MTNYDSYLPINRQTVDFLLKKLEEFENKKNFLSADVKLITLAEKFSTNDKYLSKVIRISRAKGFNEYLNDLRFSHIELWKKTKPEELKYMKIKDIASTLGYSSPEVFTKLFTERMGISPSSYFSSIGENS